MSATVAAALEAIYTQRGQLTAADVVDVAADPDHLLHRYFTWDDNEAARRYRIDQARGLIRSVSVKVLTDESEVKVRQWHAAVNASPERTGYIPEAELRVDPVSQEILLRSMRRDWLRLRTRYQHMAEFWSLIHQDEDTSSAAGAA